MRSSSAKWVLTCLVAAMVVLWLLTSAASRSFDEQRLRDTAGLTVDDLAWRKVEGGYILEGALINDRPRPALSVVLVGEVRTLDDVRVAVNPLINVLDVPAGGRRRFTAFVSATDGPDDVTADVRPCLAQWEKP